MIRFWLPQFIVVAILISNGMYWFKSVNARPRSPRLNNVPRAVAPKYNFPFVISDSQLEQVLQRAKPKFSERPKVNFVDHALRLWGHKVDFQDESLDGKQMLELLLNDSRFRQMWGGDSPALLVDSDNGIEVLTQAGRTTVSHVDHLTGTLAEIGVELSHPVSTLQGTGNVGELVQSALLNFRLNQKEYEWTALAAAFYARDSHAWYSDEGQEISFDLLAKRIMRQRQPLGVCYGQHRLYTLTMMVRIDNQMRNEGSRLFSSPTRDSVEKYLLDMSRRFHKNQSLEGYWDGNWADLKQSIPDPDTDDTSRRILATGHALEWWAMAPAEFHPPRETIARAAQWLARTVIEMDTRQIEKNYTFITHAARALALWRGKQAGECLIDASPLNSSRLASQNQN